MALQETTFLSFLFKCAKLKQSFKICHKIKHIDLSTKLRGGYTTDLKLLYFTNSNYMCSSSTILTMSPNLIYILMITYSCLRFSYFYLQ